MNKLDYYRRMEPLLIELGLSKKETKVYLYLITENSQTAAQIAKDTKESRTNTYMILEQLTAKGLSIADDSTPIRTFTAADPSKLKELLGLQRQQLQQSQVALNSALPQLLSIFSLGSHKPGVVYFQGITGFKLLLEDMTKTKDEVSLIASNIAHENKEAWAVLQKGLAKRKARGIKTKAIFEEGAEHWPTINQTAARGLELRFWGKQPLKGEIVLYDNKVALTVYRPSLIVTVITNEVLAQTFRSLFDGMWQQAKPYEA